MKRRWRWLLGGIVLLVVVFAAGFGLLQWHMRQTQPQMYAAPVFDERPPVLPPFSHQRHILVFGKTNGFRHHDAIAAANALFTRLGERNQWDVFITENAAVFNTEQLAAFDTVIWNSASGPLLTAPQQQAFRRWLENGGGWLGIHGAGGDFSYTWSWYRDEVLRAQFVMHPIARQLQRTRVNVEASQHPVMQGVQSWEHTDEWYNFEQSPRARVAVLASLDESSYHPEVGAMGADHPIIWSHRVGRGRVVYSALGHAAAAYDDPVYQRILENAVQWFGVRE